jgi:hypothetical protein
MAGKCPTCGGEYKGFRDPLSIREYKITRMCQACQDKVLGTDHLQICEVCEKRIPKGEEIIMSNYAVCSDACARALVGV